MSVLLVHGWASIHEFWLGHQVKSFADGGSPTMLPPEYSVVLVPVGIACGCRGYCLWVPVSAAAGVALTGWGSWSVLGCVFAHVQLACGDPGGGVDDAVHDRVSVDAAA